MDLVLILYALALFSVKLLVINGCLLVLLVFTHLRQRWSVSATRHNIRKTKRCQELSPYQIVHVGLGLSELHLVHTLSSVPVEERLATEHRSELLRNPLE